MTSATPSKKVAPLEDLLYTYGKVGMGRVLSGSIRQIEVCCCYEPDVVVTELREAFSKLTRMPQTNPFVETWLKRSTHGLDRCDPCERNGDSTELLADLVILFIGFKVHDS